jgi:hypothetical protein
MESKGMSEMKNAEKLSKIYNGANAMSTVFPRQLKIPLLLH